MGDSALQQVHQMRRIGMGLAAITLLVEPANRKSYDRCFKGRLMLFLCIDEQGLCSFMGKNGRIDAQL
jgi:hypothetical protein